MKAFLIALVMTFCFLAPGEEAKLLADTEQDVKLNENQKNELHGRFSLSDSQTQQRARQIYNTLKMLSEKNRDQILTRIDQNPDALLSIEDQQRLKILRRQEALDQARLGIVSAAINKATEQDEALRASLDIDEQIVALQPRVQKIITYNMASLYVGDSKVLKENELVDLLANLKAERENYFSESLANLSEDARRHITRLNKSETENLKRDLATLDLIFGQVLSPEDHSALYQDFMQMPRKRHGTQLKDALRRRFNR